MTKGMLAHLSPKERFGYAGIVGLLLFAFGFIGARHLRQPAPIVFANSAAPKTSGSNFAAQGLAQTPPTTGSLVVHVAGAVGHPGVYRLAPDSRVIDAVHAAGGPVGGSDLDAINLAAKIVDGSQLRIPTRAQTQSASPHRGSNEHVAAGIDKSGSIPVTIEPEYLPTPTSAGDNTELASTSTSAAHSGWAKKTVADVDVNTATVDQLQSLPGVGPSTAQKIFDFRQQNGAFKSIDDLLNVPGIGEKKLEKMRSHVKL